MESAKERWEPMLLEPVVPTPVFHEVLGAFLRELDEEAAEKTAEEVSENVNNLLHYPSIGSVQWHRYAVQLAASNLISTITQSEAMEAVADSDDEIPDWETLANCVVAQRKTKFTQ